MWSNSFIQDVLKNVTIFSGVFCFALFLKETFLQHFFWNEKGYPPVFFCLYR